MTSSNDESRSCAERRGWTPGPWAILNGTTVDQTYMVGGSDGQDFGLVADVTMQEDAHLIAAAPDLYESLQDLIAWVEGDLGAELPFDNARAALAKARAQ